MISEFQTLVANFHKGMDLSKNPGQLAPELRISLIDEEVKETSMAMKEKNALLTIDGLCDVLYVTYGTADVYGLELDTCEQERQPLASVANWIEILNSIDCFTYQASCAIAAIREQKPERMRIDLQELAEGCWDCAAQGLALDLRPFFREVHRTNMWKLKGPKREDGKQLKPVGWKPPRIEAMYYRLAAGNPPACVHADKEIEVRAYAHPHGGHFCKQCGGLFVDWMETA